MKRVSAILMVYAILVIASSIFWVWFALSKASLTAGSNTGNVKLATDPDNLKRDAEMANNKVTGTSGGVTEDAKVPS